MELTKKNGKAIVPHILGVETLDAKLPVKDGWLTIHIDGGTAAIEKTYE